MMVKWLTHNTLEMNNGGSNSYNYSLMRDLEATRIVIKSKDKNDPDYNAYKTVFVKLADKLKNKLVELYNILYKVKKP